MRRGNSEVIAQVVQYKSTLGRPRYALDWGPKAPKSRLLMSSAYDLT